MKGSITRNSTQSLENSDCYESEQSSHAPLSCRSGKCTSRTCAQGSKLICNGYAIVLGAGSELICSDIAPCWG